MNNFDRRDGQLKKLTGEMRRGYDAWQGGNQAKALEIYQGLLERTRTLGIESGFLLWNLAMVADNLGELEMAFGYMNRALATDPLADPFLNSFEVIVGRIRAALADDARALDDPSTPRLYDILVGAGEADLAAHVAMARWCLAGGNVARATQLSEALVTLYPADALAWRCKAEVARATGDAGVADECMAQSAACGGAPEPFAVPGVALG